ncbi:hypothetical protein D8B46_07590 [Candidatus Gracilibacteria bacterium]|nr:hypothetical protein [Candidatus Gracilibacteria bacterium]RKW21424.1 MAG: hypothetical protein D8B46_07590 [Candidatus Gracilibacteria bacterium]
MRKLFILFILVLLAFSCSQNNQNQTKETSTGTDIFGTGNEEKKELDFGLDIPDWDGKKREQITKVDFGDQKVLFYNTFPGTLACISPYTELKLMENGVRKDIYKGNFCIPEVKKIDDDKAGIYFCYGSGGGSLECEAALFEYNIKSNSWKFLDNGAYTLDWGDKNLKKLTPYTIHENFLKLLDYMNKAGYNPDLSLLDNKIKQKLKKK